ncbi:MAG: peptidase bacteriocin processing [Verrucomicrobiales bacterium]|nr:peptidase bacteriocin processing [Verrucomicrobiales bacterium]
MNWFGLATLPLGFIAFAIGQRIARKTYSLSIQRLLLCGIALLALPGIIYAVYYLKILGEPIWLYRLRTIPGSELLASLAGFPAGWIQIRAMNRLPVSRLGKTFLIPVVLAVGLLLPHLKPLLRRLPVEDIPDQWRGDACIQSTASTCGPASAATVLRFLGIKSSERELAAESFTSASGTENWYLARSLRRRGMHTSFVLSIPAEVSLPAIAGVRLGQFGDTGHFITLLDRKGDQLIYSDPMHGLSTNNLVDLKSEYQFTGFFLVIQLNGSEQKANDREH